MNGRFYVGEWLVEPEQNRLVRGSESVEIDAFRRSTSEPIYDGEAGNASKVVLVVCRNCETLDERRCSNQDIGAPIGSPRALSVA